MNPKLPPTWEATYKNVKDQPFVILGTATNECPVSISQLNPELIEMVQFFARTKMLFEACGASPYGGDIMEWPARLVDFFVVIQEQISKVESLMYK